eukprot:5173356-Alexandrium_andersonii.AAC.1
MPGWQALLDCRSGWDIAGPTEVARGGGNCATDTLLGPLKNVLSNATTFVAGSSRAATLTWAHNPHAHAHHV